MRIVQTKYYRKKKRKKTRDQNKSIWKEIKQLSSKVKDEIYIQRRTGVKKQWVEVKTVSALTFNGIGNSKTIMLNTWQW